MNWMNKPFIEYLDAVDDILETVYGITSDDANMELIASCHECNEPLEACVQCIADKYNLTAIPMM